MDLVTPDIGILFWMVLSFSIVFFILKKFAWKPILSALKDREESINNSLLSAENATKKMQQLNADNEILIAKAQKERDLLLKEAREIKEEIISQAKQMARDEANKILDQAYLDIDNERKSAINDIRKQIAIISVDIAEKIVQEKLSKDNKQTELINTLLKDIHLN